MLAHSTENIWSLILQTARHSRGSKGKMGRGSPRFRDDGCLEGLKILTIERKKKPLFVGLFSIGKPNQPTRAIRAAGYP